MAEYRQELYKKSGFNSTKNRDSALKRHRIQKKHELFDNYRNGFENIGSLPFSTSTPYHKKSDPANAALKERNEKTEDAENLRTQHLSEAEEKISRKKAYLQRFINWKKEKQQQEAIKKTVKNKPPFVACGKPKKENLQTGTLIKELKEDSIYVAVPTPKKKKPVNQKTVSASAPSNPVTDVSNGTNHTKIAKERPATKTLFKETLPNTGTNKRENISSKRVVGTDVKTGTNHTSNVKLNLTTKPFSKTVSASAPSNPDNKKVVSDVSNGTNHTKIAKEPPATKTLLKETLPNTGPNKRENISTKRVVGTDVNNATRHTSNVKLNLTTKPLSKTVSVTAPSNPDNKKAVSHSSNAVSKAKALNRKNMPPTKQPERAKLATNLKAKYRVANSVATKVANKKKVDVGTLKNDEGFNFCSTKTKSPELASQSTKRTNQPQKYNFVRLLELDTTVVESPRNKTLQASFSVAENKSKTPTPPVAEPLLRPLHLKNNSKKVFNFLKKVSLNETVEICEKTSKDKVVGAAAFKCNASQLINETPKRVTQGQPQDEPIDVVNKELLNFDSPSHASSYLSPFVTCSRGKVSARKEREKRNSVYVPSNCGLNDTMNGTAQANLETSVEVRRAHEAVLYFRKQLDNEIQRLHTLCDNWQAYKDSNANILELHGGNDMIDVTIGQTKLLTSKKFMQFSGLIDRCESQTNGTAPSDDGSEKTKHITYVDLEGFWSMLGLQVENIEKRFENLNRWKANNWEDPDEQKLQQPVERPIRTKKATISNKIKPRANEGLVTKMREMRAQMRLANRPKTDSNCKQLEKQQQQLSTETLVKYFSPRRLRRSTLTNIEARKQRESLLGNNSNSTPNRICIIVPDRKAHSIAPTVISVPSPMRQCLLSSAKRSATKTNGSIKLNELVTPKRHSSKRDSSPLPRTPTPSPVNSQENGYKPILKTPGTANRQHHRVSFNVICSVQKFRKFGKHLEATEYDQVEEVHIDEIKSKFADESKSELLEETDDDSIRTYSLRNRKVKLRPSSELE